MTHDDTAARPAHPWAVRDGERVLFHRPGSWPPDYVVNPELEALWRAGQERLYRPKGKIVQLELWESAA